MDIITEIPKTYDTLAAWVDAQLKSCVDMGVDTSHVTVKVPNHLVKSWVAAYSARSQNRRRWNVKLVPSHQVTLQIGSIDLWND